MFGNALDKEGALHLPPQRETRTQTRGALRLSQAGTPEKKGKKYFWSLTLLSSSYDGTASCRMKIELVVPAQLQVQSATFPYLPFCPLPRLHSPTPSRSSTRGEGSASGEMDSPRLLTEFLRQRQARDMDRQSSKVRLLVSCCSAGKASLSAGQAAPLTSDAQENIFSPSTTPTRHFRHCL